MSEPAKANGQVGRDDGAERDARPVKPCLKRVTLADGWYGFCLLEDGHERKVDGEGRPVASHCVTDKISAPPLSSSFGPRRK